jgi:hypothetical protein
MSMRLALIVPVFAIAGCATAEPAVVAAPVEAPVEAADSCRGDSLGQFVGQAQSEDLAKRILAATGARTIRWVEKDMMVTMEFRADRVTVYLDAAKRVERANCG